MVLPSLVVVLLCCLCPSSGSSEGELCDLCIDLVTQLEEWVQEDTTMEEIIEWVEQFCAELGLLQNLCEGLVESYLPELLENLVAGADPWTVCSSVLGESACPHGHESTTPGTTTPPDSWFYLETQLEGPASGNKVLTDYDGHCNMQGRHQDSHQLWRLKADGCLTNQNSPEKCLELEGNKEGSLLAMHKANGMDSQKWTFKDNNLESPIKSDLLHYTLVLEVMWADIPLVTDGAAIHVWKKDDTTSQKWKMVLA